MNIGNLLTVEEEWELVNQFIKNVDMIFWPPSDMLGIDTKVVSHHLAIHPSIKPAT